MNFISLTALVFAPLVMAIIIGGPWLSNNEVKIRRIAKTFASIIFAYSLCFLINFNPLVKGFQFTETLNFSGGQSWIDSIGTNYSVGVDGISILLVILTTFIVLLASIASKYSINKHHKLYYSMLFLLTTAILGVFTAKDLILFFIFWELELIPMYFLISIWGSGKKEYSAMKFVLYTFLGSIFMLASILALCYYNYMQTGVITFDLEKYTYLKDYAYPLSFAVPTFLGFFAAFAVKLPIVPFHSWLPNAHVDAPTPVSMILAGVLLKMGGYGLIRMNLQILPEALKFLAPIIVLLGVINVLYGAMVALVQHDLKKLVAYSSISHMGLVLLGIGALNTIGVTGALFQMLSHGLISAGLFMVVGIIYLRAHTREMAELGGLAQVMPRTLYFSMIIVLASLGLPLLIGFAAETLCFYGAFVSNSFDGLVFGHLSIRILTVLAASSIIVTAGYLLWMMQKVFFGNMFSKWKKMQDAMPHELVILVALMLGIVVFGLYPDSLVSIFEPTINTFAGMI